MVIIRNKLFNSEDQNVKEKAPAVISEHSKLVIRAERWLKNTLGCGVTFREFVALTSTGEIPDVIGWKESRCILIEVKATRSDFLSDKKKRHRQPEYKDDVLGHWRIYIAPPGIVKPEEVPEGWCLYEVHGRSIRWAGGITYHNVGKPPFKSNRRDEVAILTSALRRLEIRGVLERVYERL